MATTSYGSVFWVCNFSPTILKISQCISTVVTFILLIHYKGLIMLCDIVTCTHTRIIYLQVVTIKCT